MGKNLYSGQFTRIKRKAINYLMSFLFFLSVLIILCPLINIIYYVTKEGASVISLEFLFSMPKPVGESGGGIANAIVGTFILVFFASLIGIPSGILIGIYLSEFGNNRLGKILGFLIEVMVGIPSIIVGIFVYALVVVPMGGFSAMAGSIALSILLIPTVCKATEEMMRLVPHSMREASLALGIKEWKTIVYITLRTASSGITTGIMLGIARIAGETAPLLFTSLNNRFFSVSPFNPISSLTVQIFTFAISPFEEWHKQAWGAAFLLVLFILIINIVSRWFTKTSFHRR